MTVKKQKYPQEFKDEAVNLVIEQRYSDQEAADAVEVPVAYIQKWKKLKEKQNEDLILEGSEKGYYNYAKKISVSSWSKAS